MATQLQIRRGTTAQMGAFTGAEGELAVNTSTDTVHVHDGATAGGFALAKADGSNIGTYAGSFTTLAASGAVTLSSTLTVTGEITANGGIDIDNINIDGTTIALSSGDLTLDVAGDIVLDADSGAFRFKDAGTTLATFTSDSGSMVLYNATADKDLIFKGNDGGSTITALTLDMSEAGAASFSGNVGIGTSSFSHKLEIRNDVAASADLDPTSIKLYNNSDGGSAIEFSNGVAGKSKISFGVESTGAGTDDSYLGFSTAANAGSLTERLRIASTGALTSTVAGGIFETRADGGGFNYKQTLDVATAGLSITGQSNRGDVAAIRLYQTATGADGGYIQFDTSNSGSTNPSQKARIDSAGNVGIGVVPSAKLHLKATDNNYSGGFRLEGTDETSALAITHVNGDNYFSGNATDDHLVLTGTGSLLVGRTSSLTDSKIQSDQGITIFYPSTNNYWQMYRSSDNTCRFTNGTVYPYISAAGAFTNASDERLKENIVDSNHGLLSVLECKPRSFKFKHLEDSQVGFIAQELKEIIPEVVDGNENDDEMMGVNYGALVAVAFKAIQEQQATIEALTQRIQTLENN